MGIFDGIDERAQRGTGERHPFLYEYDGSTVGEYLLAVEDLATPTDKDGEQFFVSTVKVLESTNATRPVGSLATILFKKKDYDRHLDEILMYFTAATGNEAFKLSKKTLEDAVTVDKQHMIGQKFKARIAQEQKYDRKKKEYVYERDGSPLLYPELRLVALEKNFPPVRMGPVLAEVEVPKAKSARR